MKPFFPLLRLRPHSRLAITLLAPAGFLLAAAGSEISFREDIRPILSDKCFKCHGPDASNQRSPFRIDSFEEATRDHGGFVGISPGKPEESEVFWRIVSDDPAEVMPPPKSKMSLTAAEKKILERWIEQGAPYEKHWSLVELPEVVEVPRNDAPGPHHQPNRVSPSDEQGPAASPDQPIDHFIRARLAEVGLVPSPEAPREKWLRRVTLDLTGLPPTLTEIDDFLSDDSPRAYQRVVDRLLHSTAYAERMTTEWLDVARYADSYGYQVDRDREVWPWRDWVIRAFAGNMPYDRFITEQIAGDLLPGATRDQILATTFNRLHSQKVEGGSVEEEFRVEYVADRVHTFGTAFLGLTMECARCHDHKYDPLTMRDYYSLAAFFANNDDSGLYSFFTDSVPTPTLDLPTAEQESRLAEAEREIARLERDLGDLRQIAGATLSPQASAALLERESPGLRVHLDFEEMIKEKIPNRADPDSPAKTSANNRLVPGRIGQGLRLTGDDAVNLPKGVGHFSRDQPFSFALWINTPEAYDRAVIVRRSRAWTDAASRGYELLLEDGRLSAALVHFWPGDAIRVRTRSILPAGQWKHVAVTFDGSSRASGLRIWVDGRPAETEVVRDRLTREIVGGGDEFVGLGERMRDKGFKNGLVDEFRVYDREITGAEVGRLHDPSCLPTSDEVLDLYVSAFHEPSREKREELRRARENRSRIQENIRQIMVMREKPGEPRITHILNRGMYDDRGREVEPGTPAVLPPLQVSGRADRLDHARWLSLPNPPLPARVTVNSNWQMLFGRGLVSTSEDFGSQGRLPTHPELLDWLARDFVDHGWDLHHLLRQIVLSSTYRQAAGIAPELRERDPENLWLARGPTHKLPAEMIRDNALAVSGLLSGKVGGPPAKPYDLAVSFKPIDPDEGEGLHRRSLYTFWKRTGPSPLMMTLDSSTKEVCRVRREETSSPLQSLVLLNSPQFVEAARVTAENLLGRHASDDGAIIEESFRLLTSRLPDGRERGILQRLLREQQRGFAAAPEGTAAFLEVGETPRSWDGDPARLAAVTVLVSTLMNFDESFTKR